MKMKMNSELISAGIAGFLIVWILGLMFLPPESCDPWPADDVASE